MLIAVFKIADTQKQHKYPSADKRIKMWYIYVYTHTHTHTLDYSALKSE